MFLRSSLNSRMASPIAIATAALCSLCIPVSSVAQDAGYYVTDKQHLDGDT